MNITLHFSKKLKKRALSGRAFTLIEIMVAISLFMLIMVSIYSTWMNIVRGTRIGLEAAASAQQARVALHTVENAFLTAQIYAENSRYYNVMVDASDQKFTAIQFTSRLPNQFLGSGYFGDEVVRQVAFFVKQGKDGKKDLFMTQVPLLDANERKDPYEIPLARDVTHFELEFLDPKGTGEFVHEFVINTNETPRLPRLVKITLGIGHMHNDASLPNQVVMRLVNIPSSAPNTRF